MNSQRHPLCEHAQ
uniref:Uncharacterized protein n=1 Tax=Anguilla anguilla TaxID=7936 RepID=A0A0E9VNX5_ANGAN